MTASLRPFLAVRILGVISLRQMSGAVVVVVVVVVLVLAARAVLY